ncbi:hypothetical protein MLD38_002829 [Melastoma candidum]|uniref:Uncharacterized protein n=1 Tax=Melastoma candidum TaxID=119954 RepID=A0ACB9S3Q0_9MYRT|nr:hypothetical protein MLD38_002829 [Melastoma candidum]
MVGAIREVERCQEGKPGESSGQLNLDGRKDQTRTLRYCGAKETQGHGMQGPDVFSDWENHSPQEAMENPRVAADGGQIAGDEPATAAAQGSDSESHPAFRDDRVGTPAEDNVSLQIRPTKGLLYRTSNFVCS